MIKRQNSTRTIGQPLRKMFLGGLFTKAKEAFKGASEFVGRGVDRLKKAASSLFSNNLPKSFRDTLEKYKDNNIVNIQVCREPLTKAVSTFANLITAGTFNDVASKQGESGFFHLYSLITLDNGTKLIYEKNERPVLQVSNKNPGANSECVDVNGNNIPLGDFISNAMKRMGEDKYISYDPISNNCQDFLMASVQANGLSNPNLDSFIKQDTDELIEKTPAFSKQLGKTATGIGGTLRQIWEELTMKRGGRVRRRT
jgi:hypothetical protein